MRSLLQQLLAVGPELAAFILTSPLLNARGAHAITQVPSPNLDLSSLGRVALAGDFDSISLYNYEGQSEASFNTNGSQSLLTQYPDGSFQSLATADASIMTMCPFVQKDGSLAGVVIGGNFTSLGGVEAQSIALWNPNTTQVTALPGLSGKVSTVYCDASSGTVYVGGSFMAGNSTNAMAWTTGWTNLPFAGFNGPVTSITKNAAGNIVFGGDFDGLGNTTTPQNPDGQVINIGSGNITAQGSATNSDPHSIICNTNSGTDWLLQDNTAGYWQGNFSYGFNPTKLRLYNAQSGGRGTKTFYYEDLNSGGILNLNYLDANGENQSCSSSCPLANNASAQDFHFVPPVGMNAFRINIVQWYGSGGGLSGIELFQDDIYSFAVNDYNEPKCDDVSAGSASTATPSNLWQRVNNNGNSSSDYLSASLQSPDQVSPSTAVVFTPNIQQSGNYSITVYTPGCLQDSSCSTRGLVNVTGTMTSNTPPVTTTLYQSNNYDKYDQVYYGYVDVDTDNFKPSVTLVPQAGQSVPLTVVAQRVRFELITTTGGLNGLFEYNPNQAVVSTDFSTSKINAAGASLSSGAMVKAVQTIGSVLYVAGNFSGNGISNVMSVGNNATALAHGGLNAAVQALYRNGTMLYMGGNFTNTADNSVTGLSNVASYDTSSNSWIALGGGVNGPVTSLVPLAINITRGNLVECLTVSGSFTSVNQVDRNASFSTQGFAVWVPSQNNWLHNIPTSTVAISGQLTTMTNVTGSSPLYAGQISASGLYSGAVELVGSGRSSLETLGLTLLPSSATNGSSSASRRRAIHAEESYNGVYNGLYYAKSGLNITIVGGHFRAKASNGSTVENLLFINNTAGQEYTGVTGLDSDSVFATFDTYDTTLFAGGEVAGTIDGRGIKGLIAYNLSTAEYASTQPAALTGDTVIVNAIATQPNAATVYVGGNFDAAGSLPCATLCYYDASTSQWNSPGTGLGGVVASMVWSSTTTLVIAGNLTINGAAAALVTYDSKKQTFSQYSSATTPGTIEVLAPANSKYNEFWAAGTASNGSNYLAKLSNNVWTGVSLAAGTTIRGLQVMALTSDHGNTNLVASNQALMMTGNIVVPNYGNSSAALFNGTTFTPFILTGRQDGSQGTLGQLFVSNPQNLMSNTKKYLALGLVVLIGLAISLGLLMLIVIAGILMERHRRRREGYVPMPMDKASNLARIPPESLLGGLGEKSAPPKL
ncbi:hypothetical protein LTR78_004404 [Recurvomyces mirabilis]|uniref:Cellular morphogenesis protein n=1 Tax=Recurvomyces mirabilis TaxID=574656 RepID=A0AAE0WQ03_9PEZI|nr:hypothetical protein LTR78_004404 [Recurvomyces mirabilis]KAK5155930.1 hypothetical protein LTS14_005496 [Recurvomyces mirabilis]